MMPRRVSLSHSHFVLRLRPGPAIFAATDRQRVSSGSSSDGAARGTPGAVHTQLPMRPFNGGVLITALLASLSTAAPHQVPVSEQPTMVVQTGHVGRINVAAFSNDSRLIATGDHRGSISVWEVKSGRQLWIVAGHSDGIMALAFSPDGRWLASSSGFVSSFDVRIWDLETGHDRLRLGGHKGLVLNLAFSPDSRHLATAGDTVCIWDLMRAEYGSWLCPRACRGVRPSPTVPTGARLPFGRRND